MNHTLNQIFVKFLKSLGINSITISIKGFPKPSWRNILNRILNYLIYKGDKYFLIDDIEEGYLLEEYYGLSILKRLKDGGYWGDSVFIRSKQKPENSIDLSNDLIDNIIEASKNFPIFVIDMRFFNLHMEDEKYSLLIQLYEALGLVRDYLLEDTLVLTNISKDTIKPYVEKKGVLDLLDRIKPGFYNKYLDYEKAIILDPYGEEELTEEDIRENKYFILGGIVDKGNRLKGYTSKIRDLDIPHKRMVLDNTLTGVPKEINHIIEIILKVKVFDYSLKDAILSTQPKRYKRYYLEEMRRRVYGSLNTFKGNSK